jgi:hypothetical protein
MGLKRGPLSLVSTIEELLGRKTGGSGLEIREYGRRDLPRRPRGTLYPQNFAPTSLTSGDRSIGIGRSLTQATEFSFLVEAIDSCSTLHVLWLWIIPTFVLGWLQECRIASCPFCTLKPSGEGRNIWHTIHFHKWRGSCVQCQKFYGISSLFTMEV